VAIDIDLDQPVILGVTVSVHVCWPTGPLTAPSKVWCQPPIALTQLVSLVSLQRLGAGAAVDS
jgi:hypothetical protein